MIAPLFVCCLSLFLLILQTHVSDFATLKMAACLCRAVRARLRHAVRQSRVKLCWQERQEFVSGTAAAAAAASSPEPNGVNTKR